MAKRATRKGAETWAAGGHGGTAASGVTGGGLGTAIAGLAQLLPVPFSTVGAIVAPGVAIVAAWVVARMLRKQNYKNNIEWAGKAKTLLQQIIDDANTSETAKKEARSKLEEVQQLEVRLTLGEINVSIERS